MSAPERDRLAIPVYYDFASTLCYVAHRVLERMRGDLEALGVELRWQPLDLTHLTGWRRGVPLEGPRRANTLRVMRDLGVDARIPERWMDSRPAHAVAIALRTSPQEPVWRELVWTAVYEQGLSLDEGDAIRRMAQDLDLDFDRRELARAHDRLEVATELAREAQVTGVPTFMLGEWPLAGIQEEATMHSLLGRWVERRRSAARMQS